jgi:hypothetical protein
MKKKIERSFQFIVLKSIVKTTISCVKYLFLFYFNNLFNSAVINQNKNYKSIPVIIISFNQLFYLKQLIDFLKKCRYSNIVIIDNNSTYEPLLDYFQTIESSVTLHRLNENLGHLVFWKNKELFKKYSKGYYVVTDADIVPLKECSEDFVLHFKKILDRNLGITKVGFSLKINDIPDANLNKQKVIDWESQFWKKQNKDSNFISKIDTTFALYRPNYKCDNNDFYNAIRTKIPYQAKHGGWYIDNNNLTNEQKFFFANCKESSSWRIDEKGRLVKKIYLNK